MNIKNLTISSLIGGVVIAALANIPVINLINCLLCIGYWAGSILAVWLYKRFQGSLTLGQGVAVGTLSGVWSGIINFIVGLVGVASLAAVITSINQVLPPDTLNLQSDYAGRIALLINVVGIFLNIFLGALGGLIGGAILQTKPQASVASEPLPIDIEVSATEQITKESSSEIDEPGEPPAEES